MTSDFGTAPHRAFRLTLVLDADTMEALASALFNISIRADREEMTTGVSGGPSAGYTYELLTDPAMTHDEYFRQVRAYLDGKKGSAPCQG